MIRLPLIFTQFHSAWLYRREMRRDAWKIAGRMIAEHGGQQAYYRAQELQRTCMRSDDPETRRMGKMWSGVRGAIGKRAKIYPLIRQRVWHAIPLRKNIAEPICSSAIQAAMAKGSFLLPFLAPRVRQGRLCQFNSFRSRPLRRRQAHN